MKTRAILSGAILVAAITPLFAQATPCVQGMEMSQTTQDMPMHPGMQGQDMKSGQGMRGMQMADHAPCASQTAQGTGVVEAIDTAKGTITIKYQAIASIHWPAMTMTFRANPSRLLKNVKVGEKVNFTLHPAGTDSTVTAITPAE
jgi:Cu/Ag efflux protein CusF